MKFRLLWLPKLSNGEQVVNAYYGRYTKSNVRRWTYGVKMIKKNILKKKRWGD